jgi:putative transposase
VDLKRSVWQSNTSSGAEPNQNAYIERFNRTLREEILDQYLFASLDDVREAVRWWMIEYNEERAHGLLGDRTPIDYVANYARNSISKLSP